MRNFCLIFALLLLAGCGTTSGPHTYHAGPFTMVLPADMKQVPSNVTDSYVGEFQDKGIYLKFDYGLTANNFEDWPVGTEYEETKIDEQKTRIGTIEKGFLPGYTWSTQVSFREMSNRNLTLTAACRTKKDCERAKQIFRSVKFKPGA